MEPRRHIRSQVSAKPPRRVENLAVEAQISSSAVIFFTLALSWFIVPDTNMITIASAVLVEPAGMSYKRIHANSAVAQNSTGKILTEFAAPGKIACFAVCSRRAGCWGVEFRTEGRLCRLVNGTGTTSHLQLNFIPTTSSDVFWLQKGPRTCDSLPSYGSSTETTWNGTSVNPGTTIQLKCMKGTAFNTQQLISKGFYINLTSEHRFKPINLTCGNDGTWSPLPPNVPVCQDVVECLRSEMGKEYVGTKNVTETGKLCIPWASQTHDSNPDVLRYETFPDGASVAEQGNFCRNPLRRLRPWCFVADPVIKWEYCSISACLDPEMLECMLTSEGKDYIGFVNKTTSGKTCSRWIDVKNARAEFRNHLTDSGANVSTINYCRNPIRDEVRPWCFLNNNSTTYEHCATVPFCPGFP